MQRNSTNVSHSYGFTLVELLTVIAIIGILASFLVPAISRARLTARIGKAKADLAGLRTSVEGYYAENLTFPPMGNDWVRVGPSGIGAMAGIGSSPAVFVQGNFAFFASEDVGTDGLGPFTWDNATRQWIVNAAYPGPDPDGTEGNYRLDPGEDLGLDLAANDPYDTGSLTADGFSNNDGNAAEASIGENNGRLDGTIYDRLGLDLQQGLQDEFSTSDTQWYQYYAGTSDGPPVFNSIAQLMRGQPSYDAYVIFSVGPDGAKNGINNIYTATQRTGQTEFGGDDGYVGDPFDHGTAAAPAESDNDGIPFDRSTNETIGPLSGDLVFDYDNRRAGNAYGMPVDTALAAGILSDNSAIEQDGIGSDGIIMIQRGR